MHPVATIIIGVLLAFLFVLVCRVVLDYVRMFARDWTPKGPVMVICEAIYTITDPPVKALRKIIPPLRLGGISLDLSVMVLFVIIYVLINVVGWIGSA